MVILKLNLSAAEPECKPDNPHMAEALQLGRWAAERELWAMDRWLGYRERTDLLTRADRYRDLQLVALAKSNIAESQPD